MIQHFIFSVLMICCLFFADLQGKNWTDFSAWDLEILELER